MMRISIPWIIEIFEALDSLNNVKAKETVFESFVHLLSAQTKIEAIFDQSIYGSHLRASRDAARQLNNEIDGFLAGEKWDENGTCQ